MTTLFYEFDELGLWAPIDDKTGQRIEPFIFAYGKAEIEFNLEEWWIVGIEIDTWNKETRSKDAIGASLPAAHPLFNIIKQRLTEESTDQIWEAIQRRISD